MAQFRGLDAGKRLPNAARPDVGETCTPALQAEASANDGFAFTLDCDWQITSITESAAAWCGSTVEDLVGRNGREVNPAATTMLAEAVEAAFWRGATTTLEQPSTHVSGRRVNIEVSPIEHGARVRFEDITTPAADDETPAVGGRLQRQEMVLLDQQGVIVAANAAWRAAVLAQGVELANAGVGARYVDVGKALVTNIDEAGLAVRLDELLSGRQQQFEATYDIETKRGRELRLVRIAPLRIGESTYFAAIHEDLSERAKILARLHETSDQLLHAQEMERQRIAIELHDSMSQHLAGLVMSLTQLRPRVVEDARSQALIDDMTKLTQLAIRETRVLSYLMNAAGDEEESLATSVRRFVEGFGRRTGLQASFDAEGELDAVNAAARHALFRVTQEALSNVYRHAHAAKVWVSLSSRAGAVTVRVRDDGRGIVQAPGALGGEPPLGVGIAGMRARIEQLGGSLQIRGGASGTVVSATIPRPRRRPLIAAVG
jgi:signal transduction histidine kinase